jgi:hypothetical protein
MILVVGFYQAQVGYGHKMLGSKFSISAQITWSEVASILIADPIDGGNPLLDEQGRFDYKFTGKVSYILNRVTSIEAKIAFRPIDASSVKHVCDTCERLVKAANFTVRSYEVGFRKYLNKKRNATVSNGAYCTFGLRYTQYRSTPEYVDYYWVNDTTSSQANLQMDQDFASAYLGYGVERMFGKRLALYFETVLHFPYLRIKYDLGENNDHPDLELMGIQKDANYDMWNYYGKSFFDFNIGAKFYLF